jgi:hypothetical protein
MVHTDLTTGLATTVITARVIMDRATDPTLITAGRITAIATTAIGKTKSPEKPSGLFRIWSIDNGVE